MEQGNETLAITVRLEGEVKQRFLKIQKATGLSNMSEVIRFLINWYYNEKMQKEEAGS